MRTYVDLRVLWACAALALSLPASSAGMREGDPAAPRLSADWRSCEPIAFEGWLNATFPTLAAVELPEAELAELRVELDRMQPTAVRAAAILARSRHAAAHTVLLERLEARQAGPERRSDAGDVVAAEALRSGPLATDATRAATRKRLKDLSVGDRPHPDLEVRVQSACTALALGSDEVTPFLLRVLRIGTYAGQRDPQPWANVERSAWARDTAAAALSERAGVPVRFRADASIPARESAAAELEVALKELGAL